MKGYNYKMKGQTFSNSPCFFCKYRETLTVEKYCYNCVSNVDVALPKPNRETEFTHFEPRSEEHLKVLLKEQGNE